MHENHRDRLKARFLSEGLDAFEPHQALELLLFYAIPRRDTNELAHRLIARYGSVAGVLDADPSDLALVDGIGRHSAALLTLIKPLWRLYRKENAQIGPALSSVQAACDFTVDLFAGRTNEAFYLLCLDPGSRLIRCALLCEGTVNEVTVSPRAIVETALRNNAAQVILAHNHPHGAPEPSADDISFTRRLSTAFSSIGIDVADHIIVCGESAYSFAREGRMPAGSSAPIPSVASGPSA